MDMFATSTQIFVLSLIGSTFAAMISLSVLDSIADQKLLAVRFRSATKQISKVINR